MADFFMQSAGRHLRDAQILLENGRWDNSIYLAGYVVECSFKELIQAHLGPDLARAYSHDLNALQGDAMTLLRALFPFLERKLPASRTAGTVLDVNHPMRRYSMNNLWSEQQARDAVRRAGEIRDEIVSPLVLDGYLRAEEI